MLDVLFPFYIADRKILTPFFLLVPSVLLGTFLSGLLPTTESPQTYGSQLRSPQGCFCEKPLCKEEQKQKNWGSKFSHNSTTLLLLLEAEAFRHQATSWEEQGKEHVELHT